MTLHFLFTKLLEITLNHSKELWINFEKKTVTEKKRLNSNLDDFGSTRRMTNLDFNVCWPQVVLKVSHDETERHHLCLWSQGLCKGAIVKVSTCSTSMCVLTCLSDRLTHVWRRGTP